MLRIRIEGLDELKRKLSDMASGQVQFAAAQALTKTAKSIEGKTQQAMAAEFKSASPFVKRSTFVQSANKSTLTATVGLKDMKPSGGTAPAVLLKEHFTGGLRGRKPFEKAIEMMGGLPNGYRAIPGSGMKLDSYGNPSRSMIGEMLGALRGRMQIWKGRGKRAALVGYFIVRIGDQSHLHPGIYYRPNSGALRCIFVFVQQAAYRKVINLESIGNTTVEREFQSNFDAAFRNALDTAR